MAGTRRVVIMVLAVASIVQASAYAAGVSHGKFGSMWRSPGKSTPYLSTGESTPPRYAAEKITGGGSNVSSIEVPVTTTEMRGKKQVTVVSSKRISYKATFGFEAQRVPSGGLHGTLEFQDQKSDITFKSRELETLSVERPDGWFCGTGTINGAGDYYFEAHVTDPDSVERARGNDADAFEITIYTDPDYRNQYYSSGTMSGSIVIHPVGAGR